jgi:hypothetical protein
MEAPERPPIKAKGQMAINHRALSRECKARMIRDAGNHTKSLKVSAKGTILVNTF